MYLYPKGRCTRFRVEAVTSHFRKELATPTEGRTVILVVSFNCHFWYYCSYYHNFFLTRLLRRLERWLLLFNYCFRFLLKVNNTVSFVVWIILFASSSPHILVFLFFKYSDLITLLMWLGWEGKKSAKGPDVHSIGKDTSG